MTFLHFRTTKYLLGFLSEIFFFRKSKIPWKEISVEMDRHPDHLRKYWDNFVYPKLLIYEELNEIFEDNSYLQKIMLEKAIEEGKPFEKLCIPELAEKIRYVSVNELGTFLRNLNRKKEDLSFQEKLKEELIQVKIRPKVAKVATKKVQEIVQLTGVYEKIREKCQQIANET